MPSSNSFSHRRVCGLNGLPPSSGDVSGLRDRVLLVLELEESLGLAEGEVVVVLVVVELERLCPLDVVFSRTSSPTNPSSDIAADSANVHSNSVATIWKLIAEDIVVTLDEVERKYTEVQQQQKDLRLVEKPDKINQTAPAYTTPNPKQDIQLRHIRATTLRRAYNSAEPSACARFRDQSDWR